LETEDGQIGLSESVQGAVPRAVEMIRTLLTELSSKNEVQQLRSKTGRQN